MKITDLVIVDIDGKVVKGRQKPSSEMKLHLRIYQESRMLKASVTHTRLMEPDLLLPVVPLDRNVLPEVIISLDRIPLVEYGTPEPRNSARSFFRFLKQHDAMPPWRIHGAFNGWLERNGGL